MLGQPDWKNIKEPYEHCDLCAYKRAGECKVYDRFQKYPRKADGTGGLGMVSILPRLATGIR